MLDKKLKWRCRRGVRELDVLLTKFVDQVYPNLSNDQQIQFQRLLEIQDPIIMDWLYAKQIVDDKELVFIIDQLQVLSGVSN